MVTFVGFLVYIVRFLVKLLFVVNVHWLNHLLAFVKFESIYQVIWHDFRNSMNNILGEYEFHAKN